MINRYTVIGQPIAHSKSPEIHHLFGQATQRKVHYTRTEATPESFREVVNSFFANGGRGCNVTMPFKEQAVDMADRLTDAARFAQSVNTLFRRRDGQMIGHNTDGSGLLADITRNQQFAIKNKRVLLLGAGGAARGILAPLLDAEPACLQIANRTSEKAQELAELGSSRLQENSTRELLGGAYEALADSEPFHLIVNATSMSFDDAVPPLPDAPFADDALAYDTTYRSSDTAFMTWSREHGASQVCNGAGMLVEQAADSFLLWEDVRPKTRMIQDRLREVLAS